MMARALSVFAAIVATVLPARAEPPCKGTPSGSSAVTAVRDGRTFALADGREIRLAGIEAPADGAALRALIAGRGVQIERIGDDRYGRVVAFAAAGDSVELLQVALIKAGQARVAARTGSRACSEFLLAAERAARTDRLGLWADPNFAPLSSQNLTKLAAELGQFALVEGQVLSVRESGATIYVNFGRRWTRDLAVTIPKREARNFTAAGVEPKMLERRRIRVRGIVERRSGPVIDVTGPEQIELID